MSYHLLNAAWPPSPCARLRPSPPAAPPKAPPALARGLARYGGEQCFLGCARRDHRNDYGGDWGDVGVGWRVHALPSGLIGRRRSRNLRSRSGDGGDGREVSSPSSSPSAPTSAIISTMMSPRALTVCARRIVSSWSTSSSEL